MLGSLYSGNLGFMDLLLWILEKIIKLLDATGEQEKTIHIAGIAKKKPA
jgi:hypothetical protein